MTMNPVISHLFTLGLHCSCHFYRKLMFGVFLWLIGLPLLLLISLAAPTTSRALIVNAFQRSLFFCAQAVVALLYDPTPFWGDSSSFPFHAVAVDRKGRIKKDAPGGATDQPAGARAFVNPSWEDSDDDDLAGDADGTGDAGAARNAGEKLKRKMQDASNTASRLQLMSQRLEGALQELMDVGENDDEDEAYVGAPISSDAPQGYTPWGGAPRSHAAPPDTGDDPNAGLEYNNQGGGQFSVSRSASSRPSTYSAMYMG